MGYQNPPCTAPFLIRVNDKSLAIKCRLRQEHPINHITSIRLHSVSYAVYNVLFYLKSILFNPTTSCQSLPDIIYSVKIFRHSPTTFRHTTTKVFQSLKTSRQTMTGLFYTMAKLFCSMPKTCPIMPDSRGALKKCFQDLLNTGKYRANHCRKLLAVFYISPGTKEALFNATIHLIIT